MRLLELLGPIRFEFRGKAFYPQLIGEKGNPRKWIYNWYSRNGKDQMARVFARTKAYKLYRSGEFYHVSDDYLEENPLDTTLLESEIKSVYSMLYDVIQQYDSTRFSHIPHRQ